MDIQKILMATIGGGIAFFLAGWLIWGMVLEPMQLDHYTSMDGFKSAAPSMGLIAGSCLVTALLYSIIYNRWASISTLSTGAIAGAVIAGLSGLATGLMMLAQWNIMDNFVVISDLIGNIVWGGIGGGVIGWILGMDKD